MVFAAHIPRLSARTGLVLAGGIAVNGRVVACGVRVSLKHSRGLGCKIRCMVPDDDDSILGIHLIRTVPYLARRPGPQAMFRGRSFVAYTRGKNRGSPEMKIGSLRTSSCLARRQCGRVVRLLDLISLCIAPSSREAAEEHRLGEVQYPRKHGTTCAYRIEWQIYENYETVGVGLSRPGAAYTCVDGGFSHALNATSSMLYSYDERWRLCLGYTIHHNILLPGTRRGYAVAAL